MTPLVLSNTSQSQTDGISMSEAWSLGIPPSEALSDDSDLNLSTHQTRSHQWFSHRFPSECLRMICLSISQHSDAEK